MAESCYDRYLTLQPEGTWGYYNRGLLSLSKRNWAAAEHDFSKVLEHHSDLGWAYSHRAAARNGMGKHNLKAIEDLSHAIQHAPQVPEFYLLRAQIHTMVGNRELAELDRRHFLLHEPSDFIGWLYRGIAQYDRDPKDAIMDFEKALAVNPDSPLTLFKKACLLADAFGRSGDALYVLDKLIEQNPDFSDARFKRGVLLANKKGNRAAAVADAERLIQLDPTPARYYQAASIYALVSPNDRMDATRAVHRLRFALRHGYGVTPYQTDPNLRPLSNLKEFRRLAEGLEILGAGTPPRLRP